MAEQYVDKFGDKIDIICKRPLLMSLDGIANSHHFPLRHWQQTKSYVPRDDDIFIATYPKCGTTWLQEIFFALFNGRPSLDLPERLIKSPFLEYSGTEALMKVERPISLKVHTPFEFTPYASNAKYLYCVRNPKDCCVSFYYHSLRTLSNFEGATFDEFFECFMQGKCEFGNYWHHLESWMPEVAAKDNILLLTYEDMKNDILAELRRIADFIGGEWGEKLKNEETAKKVAELSSFKSMKANFKDDMNDEHIRKGIINDWKIHMTDEMSRRIEDETYSRLEKICPDLLRKWESLGALSGNR